MATQAERLARLEERLGHIAEKQEDTAKKVDAMHTVLVEARGIRRAAAALYSLGGGAIGAALIKLAPWVSVAPALALALAVAASAPVRAASPLVVRYDPGGSVVRRMEELQRLLEEGRPVMIAGDCYSACTLYLHLPRGQVCAAPGARLWFHAPFDVFTGERDPEWAAMIRAMYPAVIRAWVDRNGGLTARWLVLQGDALAETVPLCPDLTS